MQLDRSIEDGWKSTRSSWWARVILVENPSTRSFVVAQDCPTLGRHHQVGKGLTNIDDPAEHERCGMRCIEAAG